jgi:hypothetical protein
VRTQLCCKEPDQHGNEKSILGLIYDYFQKTIRDPVAGFTGLLFIATLLLAKIASAQIKDGRVVQRAYIAVDPLGIELKVDGGSLLGQVGFRNAGNLPARDVGWFVGIKWSHCDALEDGDFPRGEIKGKNVAPPGTVLPRGSKESVGLQVLNDACNLTGSVELPNQKAVFLYVWGIVRYHDGFSAGRTTKFCHRYNWINRGRDSSDKYNLAAKWARYHEHGNDAD